MARDRVANIGSGIVVGEACSDDAHVNLTSQQSSRLVACSGLCHRLPFCEARVRYFGSHARTRSIGIASATPNLDLTVVARNSEL
jgi:hypothetical protein